LPNRTRPDLATPRQVGDNDALSCLASPDLARPQLAKPRLAQPEQASAWPSPVRYLRSVLDLEGKNIEAPITYIAPVTHTNQSARVDDDGFHFAP